MFDGRMRNSSFVEEIVVLFSCVYEAVRNKVFLFIGRTLPCWPSGPLLYPIFRSYASCGGGMLGKASIQFTWRARSAAAEFPFGQAMKLAKK
jgi:hypothetical protein